MNTAVGQSNNIRYEFKLLYALGICFIVMGHCRGGGISLLNDFFPFRSFHIALFIFVSGYFYNVLYEQNVKQFLLRKTKNLILPLYLWNVFYAVIVSILKNFGFFHNIHVNIQTLFFEPLISGHQFILNLAGWFVVPLYIVHIINLAVRKLCSCLNIKINEFIYCGICLLLGVAGVILSAKGYNRSGFLVLNHILYFLPFYSLGILYKKYEKYDNLNNLLYYGIIFFITLFIIYNNNGMPVFVISWAKYNNSNVFMPFVAGALGIAFWLRTAKILTPSIGKSRVVNLIANNTYSIMINHLLGFFIVNTVYAMLYKYSDLCQGFNMSAFKTATVDYFYLPHNLKQFLIIYLIIGIIFSIFIQKFAEAIIGYCYLKFNITKTCNK